MRAVLGIDAAWTLKQPSGVALAAETAIGWKLLAVAPSYDHFVTRRIERVVPLDQTKKFEPVVADLLGACQETLQRSVDVVAIDMPMAHSPITARREADDAISRAYGSRKCGTHTPSPTRPGAISDRMKLGLEQQGYPLRTRSVSSPCAIEVYPHPALVELTDAKERLPYKAGKIRTYWPSATADERKLRLIEVWNSIVLSLDKEIAGVQSTLVIPERNASVSAMKEFEDMLDAVVCAWVGIKALRGEARPFGDDDAAIWIPCT